MILKRELANFKIKLYTYISTTKQKARLFKFKWKIPCTIEKDLVQILRLISNDFCTQLASEDKGIQNFEGKFQIITRKTVFFSVFSSVHGRTVSPTKLSAMKTHDINAKMTINTLQVYHENVIFFDFFK